MSEYTHLTQVTLNLNPVCMLKLVKVNYGRVTRELTVAVCFLLRMRKRVSDSINKKLRKYSHFVPKITFGSLILYEKTCQFEDPRPYLAV